MTRPSFEIAIRSYKRVEALATMTLPLLLSRGVPTEIIRVWTTGPEETARYRDHLGGIFLPEDQINDHGGGVGCGNAFNAIIDKYEPGTRFVSMDDDIKQIHRKIEEAERSNFGPFTELGAQPVEDLVGLFEAGFDLADEESVSLWSTYPVKNPFFMGFRSRVGLLYAEGSIQGMTLRHDGGERVEFDHGEDFERSLKHYLRDGGVLRLENYGFITAFFTQAGGMQEYRTPGLVRDAVIDFVSMYPEYATVKKPSRGNPDMLDIRFKRENIREARMIEVA